MSLPSRTIAAAESAWKALRPRIITMKFLGGWGAGVSRGNCAVWQPRSQDHHGENCLREYALNRIDQPVAPLKKTQRPKPRAKEGDPALATLNVIHGRKPMRLTYLVPSVGVKRSLNRF